MTLIAGYGRKGDGVKVGAVLRGSSTFNEPEIARETRRTARLLDLDSIRKRCNWETPPLTILESHILSVGQKERLFSTLRTTEQKRRDI